MNVNDLLTWGTYGILLLIACLTLVDLIRYRDAARIDIALMFSALAAIVLLQGLSTVTGQHLAWLRQLAVFLLVAQPYLLLRLVQHFRPVARVVQGVAIGGMVLSWILLTLIPRPWPPLLSLLIIAYFVSVEGYAAGAFVRGALRTRGVTRPRLALAAAGSGLLALVLLLAGVNQVLPAGSSISSPLSRLVALLAVLSYYLAFVPPRWLRKSWQLTELQHFLRAASGRAAGERVTITLDQLCLTGTRASGGLGSTVALWDAASERLVLRASGDPALAGSLTPADGAIERAWQERKPTVAHTPADFGGDVAPLAAALGAGALLVAPIATAERAWGLLLVFFTRVPLFATDDLELLELLAEQSAIALDYAALLQEEQALVAQLREQTGQLASANDELRGEIVERQRVAEALQQARAEAEAANMAKSEFLSRMSHELRTPMNAILGFAQVLELDELSADQRASVGHILKGGRHLLELINEVLDIARIEARRLPISLEPVAVGEVCQDVVDLIQPLASARGIQLTGLDAADDRRVMADRQRLKQVLLNLVSNAVKYNRAGGRVTFSCEAGAAGTLRLVVRDTGYGITPADLARLFMPFERLQADEHGVEGTGLGLVLSKALVEAMGGSMGVESTAGQGSTFWIELPVAEGSTVQTAEPDGLAAGMQPGAAAAMPVRTVLYIEDNLSNTKLIERILERHPNVRLLTAMQGRLGLELAREHRPDLILLDLHLPDLPGMEVLRHLKGEPRTETIPVVMLSADAMEHQVERLLAAGAQAYLTKPLDVRRFLTVLDETLQHGAT